ncbi:diacylglycerol kinase family lipid kinase [Deinococcus radiodurans]|jgi:Sphingosine kinase and enzymes related to eukaryotic diacylglycerol kinase|nr:diacylglycerol kinase family protein [Deinococcus radiodurans]QIP29397.1 diacylglycerol kinase family lipid kinase [Deinococcus radiodurans]UID70348.1 diacylglycerol kinase [Deinococcus radiodurans R1 = ATCC 13939 = DSM 20539]UTA50832.1 diacylglycerol kinase family lipid kinase [Deinococcus radiodurans]
MLVVFNPKSGQGESGLSEFVEHLRAAGAEVTERELAEGVPMQDYVRDLSQFDVLVGAGGDGTVSSLAYAARGQDVPLLAYPAGTANLIAQNLDLPRDPAELARIALAGHAVQVDLGEVEVRGEKNGFCMLAGAGADAAMIRDSEDLKERFGALAYVMSAMKQLNPKKTRFSLTIDGERREFEGIGVMVANFGMATYRLPITDDISPSDGRFTVILLRAGNILRLVPNLIDSVRGKFGLGDPMFAGNLETLEAREVTVDAADPFPLQYDGELHVETTPFTARILPGAIRLLTQVGRDELDT